MRAEMFGDLALGQPEAERSSHMGAPDFRVRGKIIAQPPKCPDGSALIKLTREQQDMMCAAQPGIGASLAPRPNRPRRHLMGRRP